MAEFSVWFHSITKELPSLHASRGAGAGPAGPAAARPKLKTKKFIYYTCSCKSQRFAEPQALSRSSRITLVLSTKVILLERSGLNLRWSAFRARKL